MKTSAELTIRKADPLEDRERILSVLERNIPQAATRARHDWLYLSNPAGQALVWLAEDRAGQPVGTSAAHPRLMRVEGEPVEGLNLSDFAFDAAYRTIGPALQLLRATLEPIRGGEFSMSYDFPSQSMHALYRRMRARTLGGNERRVLPVRLRSWARRRFGVVGGLLGAVTDLGLRFRDGIRSRTQGFDLEPLEGVFGAEFDNLRRGEGSVRGDRSSAYLQWRYGLHPLWQHTTLTCRRDGELLGFAVYRIDGPDRLLLLELESGSSEKVQAALTAGLVMEAHRSRTSSVQVETLAGSAAAAVFERLGFRSRDEGPGIVVFGGSESVARDWWIVGGDRDQ